MSHIAICIVISRSQKFSVGESDMMGMIMLDCHTKMAIGLNCLDIFFDSQFDSCGEYDLKLRLDVYDGSGKGKKRNFDIFVSESAAEKKTLNSTESRICKSGQLFSAFGMGISVQKNWT